MLFLLQKRWSSTTIIDKVVDYIPTLEKEIEKMKQKKQELMTAKETSNESSLRGVVDENQGLEFDLNNINPTVSIHQVSRLSGEVIIQICINQKNILKFSSLIHKAESEGLRIIGASTASLSDHHHRTLTCHLHFQVFSNNFHYFSFTFFSPME